MATVFTGAKIFNCLLKQSWKPQKHSIRFRTRINIQRPKPPHFVRDKVERLCRPIYPIKKEEDPTVPLYELCEGTEPQKDEIDNPLEYHLAKDALNWFMKHKQIFFFNRGFVEIEEDYEIKIALKRIGISSREYEKSVITRGLTDTIFEPALILFENPTLVGFANNAQISVLLNTVKKFHKIVLMAGIIDNRLLSLSELKYYSEIGDIVRARTSLVFTLNSAAQTVIQQLNHHPNSLVQRLQEYSKLLKGK